MKGSKFEMMQESFLKRYSHQKYYKTRAVLQNTCYFVIENNLIVTPSEIEDSAKPNEVSVGFLTLFGMTNDYFPFRTAKNSSVVTLVSFALAFVRSTSSIFWAKSLRNIRSYWSFFCKNSLA
jgi:hypothetical protein